VNPVIVRVRWEGTDAPRWPERLELWVGGWRCRGDLYSLRCVRSRKEINRLIGTDRWLWSGRREITATYRRLVPPKGGSGTAPPSWLWPNAKGA